MNAKIVSIMKALFSQHRMDEIMTYSNALLARDPYEIVSLYSLGMASITKSDIAAGLAALKRIVDAYQQRPAVFQAGEDRRFISSAALQLAQTADLMARGLQRHAWYEYCSAGARVASELGSLIPDAQIAADAGEILNRCMEGDTLSKGKFHYIKPRYPYILQIEPTNNCNLRCLMCPHPRMRRQRGFITKETLGKILSGWSCRQASLTLQNLLCERTINLLRPGSVKLFYMGEPLLHQELDTLVVQGLSFGCNVGVQTNGLLLSDQKSRQRLLSASPSGISVSVDGVDKESYEQIRKGSSWAKVCDGLKLLHEERKERGLEKKVAIEMATIVPDNSQEALQHAQKFLEPIRPFVDAIQYLLLDKKYAGAFLEADGNIKSYSGPNGDVLTSDDIPVCAEPWEKVNVLWDGRVIPCCNDINGIMDMGDATKEPIDSIWQSEKMNSFHRLLLHRDFQALPFCGACIAGSLEALI